VEKLHLKFHSLVPSHWVSFISTLIDLTTVVKLTLAGTSILEANPTMLMDIANLLQQTCNLSSLDLNDEYYIRPSALTAEHLCPMIPRHVKRLSTPVQNLDEIEKILDRLEHLSTVNFSFDGIPYHNRNIDWLLQKRRGSTCDIDRCSLVIWLANSNMHSTNTELGQKRIKLTIDDHSTPSLEQGACQNGRPISQDELCSSTDEPCDS
jgi:hypothetical protein